MHQRRLVQALVEIRITVRVIIILFISHMSFPFGRSHSGFLCCGLWSGRCPVRQRSWPSCPGTSSSVNSAQSSRGPAKPKDMERSRAKQDPAHGKPPATGTIRITRVRKINWPLFSLHYSISMGILSRIIPVMRALFPIVPGAASRNIRSVLWAGS